MILTHQQLKFRGFYMFFMPNDYTDETNVF